MTETEKEWELHELRQAHTRDTKTIAELQAKLWNCEANNLALEVANERLERGRGITGAFYENNRRIEEVMDRVWTRLFGH